MIHEIKKSDKAEEAHEWQVKYYIWLLQQAGIDGVTGVLEYPKLRQTTKVALSDADAVHLQASMQQIQQIVESETCPPCIHSKICKRLFELIEVSEDTAEGTDVEECFCMFRFSFEVSA